MDSETKRITAYDHYIVYIGFASQVYILMLANLSLFDFFRCCLPPSVTAFSLYFALLAIILNCPSSFGQELIMYCEELNNVVQ
jgi:hypothetical protein